MPSSAGAHPGGKASTSVSDASAPVSSTATAGTGFMFGAPRMARDAKKKKKSKGEGLPEDLPAAGEMSDAEEARARNVQPSASATHTSNVAGKASGLGSNGAGVATHPPDQRTSAYTSSDGPAGGSAQGPPGSGSSAQAQPTSGQRAGPHRGTADRKTLLSQPGAAEGRLPAACCYAAAAAVVPHCVRRSTACRRGGSLRCQRAREAPRPLPSCKVAVESSACVAAVRRALTREGSSPPAHPRPWPSRAENCQQPVV